MSWTHISPNDLRICLSEDEFQKLSTLSLEPSSRQIIQDTIDLLSETWRGALKGKGYEIDPR